MIYSTTTVPVNPEGATPLTRAQAWNGLVLKARDARQFLPPNLCTRCEVAEKSATHIAARSMVAGGGSSERMDSLYKGAVGVAVLAADLEKPEFAAMPFFEREA